MHLHYNFNFTGFDGVDVWFLQLPFQRGSIHAFVISIYVHMRQ